PCPPWLPPPATQRRRTPRTTIPTSTSRATGTSAWCSPRTPRAASPTPTSSWRRGSTAPSGLARLPQPPKGEGGRHGHTAYQTGRERGLRAAAEATRLDQRG